MVTKFKRVEGSLYPSLHRTFKAYGLSNNELVEYYIQDLTEEHFDKAIELIFKYHTPEETFQKAIKLSEKDYGIELLKYFYRSVLEEKVSLACFASESHEMVALNMLTVETHDNKEPIPFEIDDEDFTSLVESMELVKGKLDVFSHYNVDHFLYGVGLCVNTDYRGRGIATELLRARESLLRALSLKVTSALFTTIGSQKAAIKAGYVEKDSISYEDIHLKFPRMNFSHANATHCDFHFLINGAMYK